MNPRRALCGRCRVGAEPLRRKTHERVECAAPRMPWHTSYTRCKLSWPYPGVGMSGYVCRDTRCMQDGSCSALTGNRNVSLRMQGYTSHAGMGDISPCAGAVMQDAYVRTCANRRTLPALIENRLGRIGADQLNPCQPAEPAIHPGSVDAVKPALSSQTGYAGSPRRNQFGLPRGSRR